MNTTNSPFLQLLLLLAILLPIIAADSALIVGGGVGIGIGGGGGWIGTTPTTPPNLNLAYTALQAWKSAITSDPSGLLTSWTGPDVCSYRGIFCTQPRDFTGNPTSPASVSAIDLNRADLEGTLVPELSLLSDLAILHLNSNRFHGPVPPSLRDLSSLTELDLSNNRFSGGFPAAALYMPGLVYLDLRFNAFSGPVPEELFDKKLDAIFLNNNQFSGDLPQNLGNSPASVINLANNAFTGAIPFTLGGYMGGIREILFLNNKLTGCIPEGVGLWSDLQVLDVSSNSLTGHLPDSLSCLNGIEVLNLAYNRLSGELPDPVCSLRSLVNLTVSANFFSGLDQDCARLFFRNVGFDFSLNCIPGREMQRAPPECAAAPGDGLSCLRIPVPARPLVCGPFIGSP